MSDNGTTKIYADEVRDTIEHEAQHMLEVLNNLPEGYANGKQKPNVRELIRVSELKFRRQCAFFKKTEQVTKLAYKIEHETKHTIIEWAREKPEEEEKEKEETSGKVYRGGLGQTAKIATVAAEAGEQINVSDQATPQTPEQYAAQKEKNAADIEKRRAEGKLEATPAPPKTNPDGTPRRMSSSQLTRKNPPGALPQRGTQTVIKGKTVSRGGNIGVRESRPDRPEAKRGTILQPPTKLAQNGPGGTSKKPGTGKIQGSTSPQTKPVSQGSPITKTTIINPSKKGVPIKIVVPQPPKGLFALIPGLRRPMPDTNREEDASETVTEEIEEIYDTEGRGASTPDRRSDGGTEVYIPSPVVRTEKTDSETRFKLDPDTPEQQGGGGGDDDSFFNRVQNLRNKKKGALKHARHGITAYKLGKAIREGTLVARAATLLGNPWVIGGLLLLIFIILIINIISGFEAEETARKAAESQQTCQNTSSEGFQAGGMVAMGEKSTAELMNIYGHTQAEVEANLVQINFQGKAVRVHRLVAGTFKKVNDEITAANTGYVFKSVGTYNWRTKNCPGGCSGLSTHSFGITIDINPATNPYTTAMTHDIPQVIADIFKRNGFAWGGDWKVHDWMHFQFEGTPGIAPPVGAAPLPGSSVPGTAPGCGAGIGGTTPNIGAGDFDGLVAGQGRNTQILGDENKFVATLMKNGGQNFVGKEAQLRQLYKLALAQNVNPLFMVVIWGVEAGFRVNGTEFGCKPFHSGFATQVECSANTLNKHMTFFEQQDKKPLPHPVAPQCTYTDPFIYAYERYTPVCALSDSNGNARTNFVKYFKQLYGQQPNAQL